MVSWNISAGVGSPRPYGVSGNCRTGNWGPLSCGPQWRVGFQVHLLLRQRPPQPLHEDVVVVLAIPVHANLHPVFLQHLDGLQAGKLAARNLRWGKIWSALKTSC